VQFYSRRTPQSINFKEKYIKMATSLKTSGIKTGAVNCDKEAALCQRQGAANNLPLFKLYFDGQSVLYQTDGAGGGSEISSKSLMDFVHTHVPGDVANIRLSQQAEEFVSNSCQDNAKASYHMGLLYFSSKFETPLMLKSLSHQLKGKAAVGEVRGSNEKLVREFGLSGREYPMLIAVCGGTEKRAYEKYSGDLKDMSAVEKFAAKYSDKKLCRGLVDKATKQAKQEKDRRSAQLKAATSLTEAQLNRKRVGELRELVEDLGLPQTGLLEKSDFVHSILQYALEQKQPSGHKHTSSKPAGGKQKFEL
jgi:hypothetical protein